MFNRSWYWLFFALVVIPGPFARAADDTAAFLDAMRNRGMYDLAIDFLDTADADRLATDAFKQRIPYERGVTLIAKWRETPSASERERLAAEVRSELNQYAKANPNSPLTAKALQQLAMLLTEMATRSLTLLEQKPGTAADAIQTRSAARQQLVDARQLLTDVEQSLEKQLAGFPKVLDPKTQSDQIDRRRDMRARLSQVRVLRSLTLHQQAGTFDEQDPPFTKLNEDAAKEFQELYDKYGTFLVGFYARVYQGECYMDLGRLKEASGCFEDIIIQGGENPSVRSLVTKAIALQAEILLAEGQVDTVLTKHAAWLDSARGNEPRQPDWLMLAFQVAEAKRQKASAAGTKDGEKRKLTTEAREHYRGVAQRPGKFQSAARQILATDFAGANTEPERRDVNTFDDALQAAKDAINSMNAARQTLPAAEQNNPDGVAMLEQQAETGFADAIYYLETVQTLVDDDTTVSQRNESRWLTSWLLWQDEQFYRSAVLATFLARRYPEDPTASGAAQVALISYEKLYQQSLSEGGKNPGVAEAQKLKDLASFITRRWSSTALADTAFGVLLNFSIRDKEFDVALDLVEQLATDEQPTFRARIANAMWEAQLRAAVEKDTSVDREAMRSQAIALLESSFDGLAANAAVRDTLVAASLYLAQARLDQGQYGEAIKLLEDPQLGAIALSKTSNPIASRQAYGMEAYKAALRAYVSVTPPQSDKAVATMQELEKVAGGNDEDKLTRVYLGLGVQLQQQISDLRVAGKLDESKRVSEAFVAFLDKLNERGSSDPVVRQWIAQTYFRLAEALEDDPAAADIRTTYYSRASDAFQAMLEEGLDGSDPNRTLALKLQYGQTLRRAGKFAAALAIFEDVLADNEMMIAGQKSAAYTLQEWGAAEDTDKLNEAIAGSGPMNEKGKHVVWGWNYLGKVAASVARSKPEMRDRYKDLFYECWLNIARVSYLKAKNASGAEKSKLLDKARSVVKSMVEIYPDFINTPRRDDFDNLMKEIQVAEGNRPTGLDELVGNDG